jgi:hypothetical protein
MLIEKYKKNSLNTVIHAQSMAAAGGKRMDTILAPVQQWNMLKVFRDTPSP